MAFRLPIRMAHTSAVLTLVGAALPLLYARPPADQRPQPLDCTTEGGVSAADVKRAQEAWAKYLGGKVEEDVAIANGVTIAFILVPPGKFRMGSPKTEKDRENNHVDESLHTVTLTRPFYLGKYEVTQAQYEALTGSNPSQFKGANKPVEMVSWKDADRYCRKLTEKRSDHQTYRLPTEAQWEYSCRGGHPSSKPFGVGNGESLSPRDANVADTYPYQDAAEGPYLKSTCQVGKYRPNAFGLYDMHGNVGEWSADLVARYPGESVTDPTGPSEGSSRVMRGGGWGLTSLVCRSAYRFGRDPSLHRGNIGFRIARVPAGQ